MIDGSALKVTWQCYCRNTDVGDSLQVVGSHAILGNWDPMSAQTLVTDSASFPIWKSKQMDLTPAGNSNATSLNPLEYKFLITRADGSVLWEPISGNRTVCFAFLDVSKYLWGIECSFEHQWGSDGQSIVTHRALPPKIDENKVDSGNVCQAFDTSRHWLTPSKLDDKEDNCSERSNLKTSSRASTTATKVTPRAIHRDAFILANSGPITARYRELHVVGRGTWGEVKAVVDIATGARRAAKKIPKYFVEDAERFRQVSVADGENRSDGAGDRNNEMFGSSEYCETFRII